MKDNTIDDILAFLKKQKFILDTEKHLQEQIWQKLFTERSLGTAIVQREVSLDRDSIIDFTIDFTIGIEVKLHSNKRRIYKQCVRYCETGKINTLILYTCSTVGMPKVINGVNIYVINPSHAWL